MISNSIVVAASSIWHPNYWQICNDDHSKLPKQEYCVCFLPADTCLLLTVEPMPSCLAQIVENVPVYLYGQTCLTPSAPSPAQPRCRLSVVGMYLCQCGVMWSCVFWGICRTDESTRSRAIVHLQDFLSMHWLLSENISDVQSLKLVYDKNG